MRLRLAPLALFLAAVPAATAIAQSTLRLPEASPSASAGQTIGITDVDIRYHRPTVGKRKIWGGLVPYGVLWRAGANENTTISFSTPVKIEGKPVPAGAYALYMLPSPSEWTLVLSRFTGDWGTYNYDPSEDALRVPVTPAPLSQPEERLSYGFDDLTDASAVASLRWEKLRVPFRIEVDLPATVRASIKEELRGGKHWSSDAWAAAARWELRSGDVKTAREYADHGLAIGSSFTALRTKATVLEKSGDAKGAAQLRERANLIANEAEAIGVVVGPLMAAKKFDEAIAYLSGYAVKHPGTPEMWRVHAALGDVYSAKKDYGRAKEEWDKAMAGAHDFAEKTEVQDSINAEGAQD
ncbi:MAG: DUF2911 domain-containing protein [Thermoanaerobaculia bacterium]